MRRTSFDPYLGAVIVLEGANASGKTTLAREIECIAARTTGNATSARRAAAYIHAGDAHLVNLWRRHVATANYAARIAADGRVAVVDRTWISEAVYGPILRGNVSYPIAERCIDRIYLALGAVYVLCVPTPLNDHWCRLAEIERKWRGRENLVALSPDIVARYADLRFGSSLLDSTSKAPAAPRDYFELYVRRGDFTHRSDVLVFDYTSTSAEHLAHTALYLARAQRWPLPPLLRRRSVTNYGGSITRARAIIVGDRPSPRAPQTRAARPFVWHCARASAATTLNRALHALGIVEPMLAWTNATSKRSDGNEEVLRELITARPGLPVIALGHSAETHARAARAQNIVRIDHPGHVRRFHQHDGGYEQWLVQLRNALELAGALARRGA